MNIYQKIRSKNGGCLNDKIMESFLSHYNGENIKKTHFFGGRYENIYLTEQLIPALGSLIAEATKHAEDILQLKNLRAGYWFNYMPSESSTSLHTHDDDDELLSAVYYVDVAEHSGNLIIYQKSNVPASRKKELAPIEITPEAGDFIFFKPDVPHEVSRNNSSQARLSIGFNFGQP